MKTPIGLFGLSSLARLVWMRLAIICDAVLLADDALADDPGEVQDLLHLVGDHPADGDAGPVRDDRRHRLLVDMGVDHAPVGMDRLERADARRCQPSVRRRRSPGRQRLQRPACCRRSRPRRLAVRARRRRLSQHRVRQWPAPASGGAELRAQLVDLLDERALLLPLGLRARRASRAASAISARRARRCAPRRRCRGCARSPWTPSRSRAPRSACACPRPRPARRPG